MQSPCPRVDAHGARRPALRGLTDFLNLRLKRLGRFSAPAVVTADPAGSRARASSCEAATPVSHASFALRNGSVSSSRESPNVGRSVDVESGFGHVDQRQRRTAAQQRAGALVSAQRCQSAPPPARQHGRYTGAAFVPSRRRDFGPPPPRRHEASKRRGVDERLVHHENEGGFRPAAGGCKTRAQRRRHAVLPLRVHDDAHAVARTAQRQTRAQRVGADDNDQRRVA